MSEQSKVTVTPQQITCQNTGNPVLDSLVNLLMARSLSPAASGNQWDSSDFEETHRMLIEASAKEPDGLRRWGSTY
jgi:hypothetical protein